MNTRIALAAFVISSSWSIAQTLEGVTGDDTASTFNQQFLARRHLDAKSLQPAGGIEPKVVVFTGDRVFPHVVDGDGWQTSFFFVNLENHPVTFQVLFFDDVGNDMFLPIVGLGSVRQVSVTLDTAGSTEFETAGIANSLKQGWALLSQTTTDTVGGMAVFKQHVFGRPDQEAVVPIVNQFDSHFVLLFDNTSAFITGIALSNPSLNFVGIPVTIRNQSGQVIDQRTITLGPYGHTAFSLPFAWSSTQGRRGAIEFQTNVGVGVLGLRFNGSAFTSFNVLENINWR